MVDWASPSAPASICPRNSTGSRTPRSASPSSTPAPAAYLFGDWHTGNTVNMAISQDGDLGVTPMQLANMYAALANGGTLTHHVGMAMLRPVPGTWQEDPGDAVRGHDDLSDEGVCTVHPTQLGAVEIRPGGETRSLLAAGVAQSSQGGTSGPAF